MNVIIDVDTGIDDAIALSLAVSSKSLNILGITTVSGNIHVDKSTINTLRVLKFFNKENIKVYKGCDKPLKRKLVDASIIHGKNGLAGQLEEIDVEYLEDKNALVFLEEQILKYKDDITIVMTGPETNLATLIKNKPYLVSYIKSVILMGGVVKGKGNHTPVSEYNILTDPEAASIVFSSGLKNLTMVGLDVTQKALLYREDLNLIKDDKVKEFIESLTYNYMERYFQKNGIYACPMHDPLVILYLLNNDILKIKKEYVAIETNSTYCDGMTVCDFENHWGKQKNVNVALDIDKEKFKKMFFKIMNSIQI